MVLLWLLPIKTLLHLLIWLQTIEWWRILLIEPPRIQFAWAYSVTCSYEPWVLCHKICKHTFQASFLLMVSVAGLQYCSWGTSYVPITANSCYQVRHSDSGLNWHGSYLLPGNLLKYQSFWDVIISDFSCTHWQSLWALGALCLVIQTSKKKNAIFSITYKFHVRKH